MLLKLKSLLLVIVVVLFFSSVAVVQAAPDIMTPEQITPGMRGIAKTVVAGTKIEEFGVEILGVMKDKGVAGDLILVRTYGDVIDRTGGIVQGMSGSPVYIGGKLIGAIAYGWPLTDHKIGMITPITDMLKLWDEKKPTMQAAPEGQTDKDDKIEKSEKNDKVWEFTEQATPLMVSGFSQEALALLQQNLPSYQLVPYAVGDAPDNVEFGPIEPGSSVGVQLVRGDVSMEAIGTVTYMEGNKILAFGHPFLNKGKANYLMTNAYIFTTVDGLQSGFKVGTAGQLVGTINQDRGAGIAGSLGVYPGVIPVRIVVQDNDLGKTQVGAVQVAQEEMLSPILTATTAFNFMQKAMDRVGSGTARVKFEITAKGMPGETLIRDNMFYSGENIGEVAVSELFEAMAILAVNRYQPVDIEDVKVNIIVGEDRRIATIMDAHTNVVTAKPGDTVEVVTRIKPYRGEAVLRNIPFTIPKGQAAGAITLEVRGGGIIPLAQLLKQQTEEIDLSKLAKIKNKNKNKSFENIMNDFKRRDHNNDIVVEVIDTASLGLNLNEPAKPLDKKEEVKLQTGGGVTAGKNGDKGTETVGDSGKASKDNRKSKVNYATDYIIDGDTQVVVNVVNPHSM